VERLNIVIFELINFIIDLCQIDNDELMEELSTTNNTKNNTM
jgi:hypothetical protein